MTIDRITTLVEGIKVQSDSENNTRETIRKMQELLKEEVRTWLKHYPFNKIKWKLRYSQYHKMSLITSISGSGDQELIDVIRMYSNMIYDRYLDLNYGGEEVRVSWNGDYLFFDTKGDRNLDVVQHITMFNRLGLQFTQDGDFYNNIKIVRDKSKQRVADFIALEKIVVLDPLDSE